MGRHLVATAPTAVVSGRETCREEAATELANCLESLASRIVWSSELVKAWGYGTGMTSLNFDSKIVQCHLEAAYFDPFWVCFF